MDVNASSRSRIAEYKYEARNEDEGGKIAARPAVEANSPAEPNL
jgi:hypothetical protein